MVKRICPICDQEMKNSHFCTVCRKWVSHPYMVNMDFYMNERHPQDEKGCEYHEPSFMKQPVKQPPRQTISQAAKQPLRQPVGQAAKQPPSQSPRQTISQAAKQPPRSTVSQSSRQPASQAAKQPLRQNAAAPVSYTKLLGEASANGQRREQTPTASSGITKIIWVILLIMFLINFLIPLFNAAV